MNSENNIDIIIDELVKTGSSIEFLKEIKKQISLFIKKDEDLCEILSHISKEIKEQTEEFLNLKNQYGINYITGISTCIYFPSFKDNGEYKLKIFGGKTCRIRNIKVDENTLFDIDAITKMFTLILLFRLEEMGYINLNDKICDINSDFKNLGDFTLNDLIKFNGKFKTHGNIIEATSLEDAYKILKSVYLISDNEKETIFSDYSAIIIGDTIEKVLSNIKGENVTFEEIMYEYLLSPLNLYHTQFNPNTNKLAGNGNTKRLVYNKESRILGGAIGSSGIFTNSEDLLKLSKALYKVNYYKKGLLKKVNLDRLGYYKTEILKEFSSNSFSCQGQTGSFSIFDPNNLIHNNILVNAIYEDDDKNKVTKDKPVGFYETFNDYKKQIFKNIMLMYIIKKYYNRYFNIKENIEITKFIK